MKSEYIHPNFSPTNKDAYLNLINRLREECWNTDLKKIEISKEDYDILEDATHPSMKDKGHQVYGVEIIIRKS